MTIQLPEDLEDDIRAEVLSGHFASEEDMVATVVREYLRQRRRVHSPVRPAVTDAQPDLGSIGAMREDADFLDEIVAGAMKARQEQPWRLSPGE